MRRCYKRTGRISSIHQFEDGSRTALRISDGTGGSRTVAGRQPASISESANEAPQNMVTFHANGQSSQGNNTNVDGLDDNDPLLARTYYVPQMEGV
jgi:hypothetical protein